MKPILAILLAGVVSPAAAGDDAAIQQRIEQRKAKEAVGHADDLPEWDELTIRDYWRVTLKLQTDQAKSLRRIAAALESLTNNAPAVKQPEPYRWWEHVQPLTNAPREWWYYNQSKNIYPCIHLNSTPAASPRPDEEE